HRWPHPAEESPTGGRFDRRIYLLRARRGGLEPPEVDAGPPDEWSPDRARHRGGHGSLTRSARRSRERGRPGSEEPIWLSSYRVSRFLPPRLFQERNRMAARLGDLWGRTDARVTANRPG